jgi:hypothetical protein
MNVYMIHGPVYPYSCLDRCDVISVMHGPVHPCTDPWHHLTLGTVNEVYL